MNRCESFEFTDRDTLSNDCSEMTSLFDSFEDYLGRLDSFLKFDSPDKWLGIQKENDSSMKNISEISNNPDIYDELSAFQESLDIADEDTFSGGSEGANSTTSSAFSTEASDCLPEEMQSSDTVENHKSNKCLFNSRMRRLTCDEFISHLKLTRESISHNYMRVSEDQESLLAGIKIDKLGKLEKKRLKVVEEIQTTEKTYFHHLELIVDLFMEPLQSLNVLPEKVFITIFNNIQLIMSINKELSLHLLTKPVGEAFLLLAPFLKLYSTYAQNHERALAMLLEWDQRSPEFAKFRRKQEEHPEMKGLKLNALLITPVQRVPRYKLLLEELLSCTPAEHDDFKSLREAAKEIASVANHINEHIRQQDNFMKMFAIQKSLSGARLLTPGRTFIKEGTLKKVSNNGTKYHERLFFLFSDILIYAKPRLLEHSSGGQHSSLKCCCTLPLQHCIVDRVLGGTQSQGSLFSIKCKNEFLLLFSDQTSVGEWISVLKKQINEVKLNRKTLRKKSSAAQPLRQENLLNFFKRKLTPHTTPEKNCKNKTTPKYLKPVTSVNSTSRRDQVIPSRLGNLACIRKSKEKTSALPEQERPKVFKDLTLIEESSIFAGHNITLNDSLEDMLPIKSDKTDSIISTIFESDEQSPTTRFVGVVGGQSCSSGLDSVSTGISRGHSPTFPTSRSIPNSTTCGNVYNLSHISPHVHVTIRKSSRSHNKAHC